MKKRLSMFLLALVMGLAFAIPAAADAYNYVFYYSGSYHEHSSGYIAGPAIVEDGEVTITLTGGDYFPEVIVGGVPYEGTYDPITGLTTFEPFPGDNTAPINIVLLVEAGPHSQYYPLTIVW